MSAPIPVDDSENNHNVPPPADNQQQQQQQQQQQYQQQRPSNRHHHQEQRRKPEVDQILIDQFIERYSQQDDKELAKLKDEDEKDEIPLPEQQSVEETAMLHKMPPGSLNVVDCCNMIDHHDVTFVVTDTGTGKSSLIPLELMKRGARVASSQPRRTATINLALRVASLREEKIGKNVGYFIRGEKVGDPDKCQLMFMTSYSLLLYVLSHPTDFAFTHFLIDEFHERQPDVEVMLGLLLLAKQRMGAKFKIVLLSASVEVAGWKSYFEGMDVGIYSTCRPRYSVHEYYMEEVCKFVGAQFNPPTVTYVEDETSAAAIAAAAAAAAAAAEQKSDDGDGDGEDDGKKEAKKTEKEEEEGEKKEQQPTAPPRGTPTLDAVQPLEMQNIMFVVERMLHFLAKNAAPTHSILVFLPGRTQVEKMKTYIQRKLGEQLEPIAWYRDVDLHALQAALQRSATIKKKVYLATDIAEVSLTLPDVVFVIDSGTTKKPRIDPKNRNSVAFPPLELLYCSRSSVAQRRGRVGRVQQGFYFCMVPEQTLPMLKDMEPQIANQRINELSLHVLEIVNNPQAVFNICRMVPKAESVQLSINYLIDSGYILPATDEAAKVESVDSPEVLPWREAFMNHPSNAALRGSSFVTTFRGKLAQHLPLSTECSNIVVNGVLMGLEPLMVLAGAIADTGSPFYVFTEDKRQDFAKIAEVSNAMKDRSLGFNSDMIAALNLVIDYKGVVARGLSEETEMEWCAENQASRSRLQNILCLETQTKEQLAGQISFVDVTDPQELMLMLREHALVVHLLVAASHLERTLFVQFDARTAQIEKRVGPCVFLGINSLRDFTVATCVDWSPGKVIVPISTQIRYNHLLSSFALELTQQDFNLLLLCFASLVTVDVNKTAAEEAKVAGEDGQQDQQHDVWLGVEMHQKQLVMRCSKETYLTIMDVRKRMAGVLRTLRVQSDKRIMVNDEGALNDAVAAAEAELGISDVKTPASRRRIEMVGAVKQVFGKLVERLQCTPDFAVDYTPVLRSCFFTRFPAVSQYKAPPRAPVAVEPPEIIQQQQQQRGRGGGGGGFRGGRRGGHGGGGPRYNNAGGSGPAPIQLHHHHQQHHHHHNQLPVSLPHAMPPPLHGGVGGPIVLTGPPPPFSQIQAGLHQHGHGHGHHHHQMHGAGIQHQHHQFHSSHHGMVQSHQRHQQMHQHQHQHQHHHGRRQHHDRPRNVHMEDD